MYTVWFQSERDGDHHIFTSFASEQDALRVSEGLMEEGFAFMAWVE